jgi:hypothetical protein
VFSGRRSVEGHLRDEELSVPKVSLRGNIVPRNGYMREYDQIAMFLAAMVLVRMFCLSAPWGSPHSSVGLREIGTCRS